MVHEVVLSYLKLFCDTCTWNHIICTLSFVQCMRLIFTIFKHKSSLTYKNTFHRNLCSKFNISHSFFVSLFTYEKLKIPSIGNQHICLLNTFLTSRQIICICMQLLICTVLEITHLGLGSIPHFAHVILLQNLRTKGFKNSP